MSKMSGGVRRGTGGIDGASGGIAVYSQERLYEELAYLAYYLHWPHNQLLDMEHMERRRWVGEVSDINQRLNES